MTPDQYRREGFRLGIEAAAHQVKSMRATDGVLHKQTQNLIVTALNIAAIRAIDVDEVLAGMPTNADAVAQLVEAARTEAEKAMRKFPQPNYVISKVAEEAGEVVKAAIHCAEGREKPENVRAEIVQAMAMLIRLYVEGDQVHGLPALAAMETSHD